LGIVSEKETVNAPNPWASEDGPDVLLDLTHVREITETTLVDEHQSQRAIMEDLSKGAEYLGDGFLLHDTPVLIQRGPDGGIVRITPLNEVPGVHFEGTVLKKDIQTKKEIEAEAALADARPTPVPLNRDQRNKLRHILTTRLYNHYLTEASLRNRAKWNPFRDGLPELPEGADNFMSPTAANPLVPATQQQVYDYLLKHVAQRAKIMDSKRFGGGTLQDITLRID
jgi:hypothetical protein